jgi:hypothetical protein
MLFDAKKQNSIGTHGVPSRRRPYTQLKISQAVVPEGLLVAPKRLRVREFEINSGVNGGQELRDHRVPRFSILPTISPEWSGGSFRVLRNSIFLNRKEADPAGKAPSSHRARAKMLKMVERH